MDSKTHLREALQEFRVWADANFPAQRYGEWECEYEHWGNIYEAAKAVMEAPPSQWDDEIRHLLIYAIARDNEVGRSLISRPNTSRLGLRSGEYAGYLACPHLGLSVW